MVPNPNKGSSGMLTEDAEPEFKKLVAPQAGPWKYELVYKNLVMFAYWHMAAIYGLYLLFTSAKWATIIFTYLMYTMANLGITAGAHRLWTHRAYKAKLPLQIILIIMNSIAFHDTALSWARDHRMHHRYSDTDADPHNSARGLFFSHIGWLLVRKHPELKARGKYIPLDDLRKNPVLRFQKKYAIPMMGTFCFLMPTLVPVYFWGESISTAWHINLLRYLLTIHFIFLVNSVGHKFGNKPYDRTLRAVQNIPVSIVALGECFHNYHHTYPWDYRAAELGNNMFNWTTLFIDFFAYIGWAYDLKTAPKDAIEKRMARTGDGTDLWNFGEKRAKDSYDNSAETYYDF